MRRFLRKVKSEAAKRTRPQVLQGEIPTYPPDEKFNEFQTPAITAWKLARTAIEHENNLVNQRITWLLSSQAFLLTLFTLLFIAWGKGELDKLKTLTICLVLGIGVLAIYICVVIQNSLYRAFLALNDITQHYNKIADGNKFFSILKDENGNDVPMAITPPLHLWRKPLLGIINQHFLPLAVIFVWLLFLGACLLQEMRISGDYMRMRTILEILGFLVIFVLGCMIGSRSWPRVPSQD